MTDGLDGNIVQILLELCGIWVAENERENEENDIFVFLGERKEHFHQPFIDDTRYLGNSILQTRKKKVNQFLQKGGDYDMSAEEKEKAMEFITNYQKLDHGDQRYVQGWVDAKAASQQEKREEEKGA